MKKISELVDGDIISGGLFLVTGAQKGVMNNGRNYLTVTLQDSSGSIDGKIWDAEEDDFEVFAVKGVVSVSANVIMYKNSLQLKILSGEKMNEDIVDPSLFVVSAPVPKAELEKKLQWYLDSLTNPDVKKLTEYIIKKHYSEYTTYPAAVRNHHNFASGILYHSISMANLAEGVCKLYPNLNRDILVAGTLIHDVGKTEELSGPIATEYTLEGKLLGHISICQADIKEAADVLKMDGEIPLIMEHMVISHHGIPEFGSPIEPLTREAVALSMIDDFDAKMNMLDKAYDAVKPGDWTERLFAMDNRAFYKPLYTGK